MMGHARIENRVRDVRLDLGMTQEHLAEIVGVARQSIISIEKGRFIPTIETALRLSVALKVPVEHLFWPKVRSS
jgi:putative transcriptional regulator